MESFSKEELMMEYNKEEKKTQLVVCRSSLFILFIQISHIAD